MVEVSLDYNPYNHKIEFLIDGNNLLDDSCLKKFECKRLQDNLKEIKNGIIKETNSKNIFLKFIGRSLDFEDVEYEFKNSEFEITLEHILKYEDVNKISEMKEIFEEYKSILCEYNEKLDIDVEKKLKEYLNDKVKVNIMATMSAGKSTLINALIGKNLLPTSTAETTSKVMEVIDNDSEENTFNVKYKYEGMIQKKSDVTKEILENINKEENIDEIEIEGNIGFINTEGSCLSIVDTPGFNGNESNISITKTYISNSDKVMNIFVLDSNNIAEDTLNRFFSFLDKEIEKEKKDIYNDRMIVVLNKADSMKISEIEKNIKNIEKKLKERELKKPNLILLDSKLAISIRDKSYMEEDEFDEFEGKINKVIKYKERHYNEYSKLPKNIKNKIELELEEAIYNKDRLKEALIYTGIRDLEEMINLFVKKYAIPIKVKDFYDLLSKNLSDRENFQKLISQIPEDEKKLENTTKKINELKNKINNDISENFSKGIDECIKKISDDTEKIIDNNFGIYEEYAKKFKQELKDKMIDGEISEIKNKFIDNSTKKLEFIQTEIEKSNKITIEECKKDFLNKYKEKIEKLEIDIDNSVFKLKDFIKSTIDINMDIESEINFNIMVKTEIEEKNWFKKILNWFTGDSDYYTILTKEKMSDIINDIRDKVYVYKNKIKKLNEKVRKIQEEELKLIDSNIRNKMNEILDNLSMLTNSKKTLLNAIENNKKIKESIENLENKIVGIIEK